MGSGASKGKKPADGSKELLKAQESAAEAKALFEKIDVNKDGKLNKDELKAAVKNSKKDFKATWTDDLIHEVINFFDRDGDDMLDLDEFTDVLHELKARGAIDSANLRERAAKRAELKTVFDKHAKEGGEWDRGSTGKLIRELNDGGYWDDFGAKVTSAHAQLTKTEDKKAKATLEDFVAWYPTLLAEIEAIKLEWAEADAARMAAKAKAKADEFAADKAEWTVLMKRLPDALKAAWDHGKTALLIDMTTPKGENKNEGFSPLENFYSYSGDTYIELKKGIVEVNVKKEKTVEELLDEYAQKLMLGLKQGRPLVLLCSTGAPPFTSKFTKPDRFPLDLVDAAKLKACLGTDADIDSSFLGPVVKWSKEQPWGKEATFNVTFGHADFRVVVVTKFDPDDYRDFLQSEWPFDKLQPIKVVVED